MPGYPKVPDEGTMGGELVTAIPEDELSFDTSTGHRHTGSDSTLIDPADVKAKRTIEFALNAATALAVTDKAYARIPLWMNGWNLVAVAAMVKVASTSGAITLTVKNAATSMLSTDITIDQDEFDTLTAATPAVIDTGEDDVATGAQIEVAVTGAGVAATYCVVELTFQLP